MHASEWPDYLAELQEAELLLDVLGKPLLEEDSDDER